MWTTLIEQGKNWNRHRNGGEEVGIPSWWKYETMFIDRKEAVYESPQFGENSLQSKLVTTGIVVALQSINNRKELPRL